MGKSLTMKILSVVGLGILLAHLSPVATGILLCIGDGTDPDCCSKPHASQSLDDEMKQLRDGSDCGCCVTVDAAPSTAGTASQKASVEVLAASRVSRNADSPTTTRFARLGSDDTGNSRLSSLRTVVLLN